MRILFDQGTPAPLKEFDLLITTDRNLRHQQDLAAVRIAILVLPTTSWPRLQRITREIAAAVDSLKSGQFVELPPL